MSLEIALQENTTALREMMAVMARLPAAPAAEVKAEVKMSTPAGAKVAAPSTHPASAAKAVAATSKAPPFPEIVTQFVAMVKAKGPDSAAELLTHFGLDAAAGGKLSHIPADRHAELVAEIAARSV